MKVLEFITVPEKQYKVLLAEFVSDPQDAQMGSFVGQLTARLFMESLLGGCPVDDSPEGRARFERLVEDVYAFVDLFADTVDRFKKLIYVDMDLEGAKKALWPLIEAVRYEMYAGYWLEHVEFRLGGYYSTILDAAWDLNKGSVWHFDDGRPVPGTPLPPTAELIQKALADARPDKPAVKAAGESKAGAICQGTPDQSAKKSSPAVRPKAEVEDPAEAENFEETAAGQSLSAEEGSKAAEEEKAEDAKPGEESENTGKEGA